MRPRGPGRRMRALAGGLSVLMLAAVPNGVAEARQQPPPPLPSRPLEFPGFETFTLDNGLRVVVVSYGAQPVMSARLYVRGGRANDPPAQAGLAGLTATVLTRGTTTRSAPDISGSIEGVGGSLSAAAGQDFLNVSAVVLTEAMETAFTLLADVTLNATFPEEEVELARRQALSELQAELGNPQAIAARRFAAVVYGDGHPYGVAPTPRTVEAISRSDLVDFRDRVLRPEGALLLIAGRVDRVEIEEAVRRHFAGWSGEATGTEVAPDPVDATDTRIYLVHRPGSVQSVVSIGHLGIDPGNPDFFALQVLNRVLGGGSDARLFRILREERGWTYGAYSQFTRPALRGHFAAQAEVRTEVTDSTVVEILRQIQRVQNEPVEEEELEGARSYLAGSFPLRLETADQVAGQIATTLLLDLPIEDVTQYPARIRAVDAAAVQRVARDHLSPDRIAIVVVGDGALLAERLEAIAPVEYFDVEGAPLTREEVATTVEPERWNGERLSAETRRYEAFLDGVSVGTAEYRLDREGEDWISTATVSAAGSFQESRLRFRARDLAPRSFVQESVQGPLRIRAELAVEGSRIEGELELPPQLGGDRRIDEPFPEGLLFAGMDEYALSVAPLAEGARFSIPYFDLIGGNVVRLEARVTGEGVVSVPAGEFTTWRVHVEGGEVPVTLHLRKAAPHFVVRQEYAGQPLRFDLTAYSTH